MSHSKKLGIVLLLFGIIIPIAAAYLYQMRTQTITQTIIAGKPQAMIFYRSNTGNYLEASPKQKTWKNSVWGTAETELASSGNTIRWLRTVACPLSSRLNEIILVTLSSDAYLDAYVWDGNAWHVTNNIGLVNSGADVYQSFDIAYEFASGRAILVYAVSSSDPTHDLAYQIWDGVSWSSEAYIDDSGHSNSINYRWVELASKPTTSSNELALMTVDQTNGHCNAWIWSGSAWGNFKELENSLSSVRDAECLGVAYEQLSGRAMFVWCYSGNIRSLMWGGSSWGLSPTTISISTLNVRWVSVKSAPGSNRLMTLTIDGQSHLNTIYWDGSMWASPVEHSTGLTHSGSRCADFEWDISGNAGLLIWSVVQNSVSYKVFNLPSSWGSVFTVANAAGHPWIQLRRNLKYSGSGAKILGLSLNGNNDFYGFSWDGATVTYESTPFTLDVGATSYECFELVSMN